MLKRILLVSAFRMLILVPSALGQTIDGPYAAAPPGSQKIADSLYQAERPSPLTGVKPVSRDQIVAAKNSGEGWGMVFKDMQADGLVTTRNLGQTVSGQGTTTGPAQRAPVTVTLGNGRTVLAGTTATTGHGTVAAAHGQPRTATAATNAHGARAAGNAGHGGGHGGGGKR